MFKISEKLKKLACRIAKIAIANCKLQLQIANCNCKN